MKLKTRITRRNIHDDMLHNIQAFSGMTLEELPPSAQKLFKALVTATAYKLTYLQDQIDDLKKEQDK